MSELNFASGTTSRTTGHAQQYAGQVIIKKNFEESKANEHQYASAKLQNN